MHETSFRHIGCNVSIPILMLIAELRSIGDAGRESGLHVELNLGI